MLGGWYLPAVTPEVSVPHVVEEYDYDVGRVYAGAKTCRTHQRQHFTAGVVQAKPERWGQRCQFRSLFALS